VRYWIFILLCRLTSPFRYAMPWYSMEGFSWRSIQQGSFKFMIPVKRVADFRFATYLLFRNPYVREIVECWSKTETGAWTSDLCTQENNFYAMRPSLKRKYQNGSKATESNGVYASYSNVYNSVYDLYNYITDSSRRNPRSILSTSEQQKYWNEFYQGLHTKGMSFVPESRSNQVVQLWNFWVTILAASGYSVEAFKNPVPYRDLTASFRDGFRESNYNFYINCGLAIFGIVYVVRLIFSSSARAKLFKFFGRQKAKAGKKIKGYRKERQQRKRFEKFWNSRTT